MLELTLKRRRIGVLVVASLSTLALVAVYFVADSLTRNHVENRVEQEIAAGLPENVTGDVQVSIGGVSVFWQYLVGNFDRVDLMAPALEVSGVPASVHIVATDVPTNTTLPVGEVHGTLDFSSEAFDVLLSEAGASPDAKLELGDGDVAYSGSFSVLGLDIGYRATAVPRAVNDNLVLTPQSAELTSTGGVLDVSWIVQLILDQQPLSVCIARYVPVGVELTGVNVTPERARIMLYSSGLALDEQPLSTLGSCPGG